MPRRRITGPTVYDNGLKPGNIVVVTAPYVFKNSKLAVILDIQRWCKNGIPVMLVDEEEPIRYVCIMVEEHGDTIIKA